MKIRLSLAACALSLVLLTGLTGCSLHKSLKVGVIDTERIVRENPKYMELNVLLMREREEFYSKLPRDVRDLGESERKALQEKVNKDATERSSKFDKLYREFMKKLQTDIKEHAASVAKDKNIDMIIIDTASYPTVLYSSGENITTDIMLKMKE